VFYDDADDEAKEDVLVLLRAVWGVLCGCGRA